MINCLDSMAPKDEDLLRHVLDREPLARLVKAHLKKCAICQQRLASYRLMNTQLLKQLYRSECPTPTRLSYYCANLLPIAEVMQMTAHLKICPLCEEELKEMRTMLQQELYPESKPAEAQSSILRIIASLVPWQPQLAMRGIEVRPKEQSWPRQYRADTIHLSLHLSRDSSGDALLLGLLTSSKSDDNVEEFDGTKAELYSLFEIGGRADERVQEENAEGQLLFSTQVDDLGNLVFKKVPDGKYMMIVYLPESEIVIEDLIIAD